jgi:hypothetical protein
MPKIVKVVPEIHLPSLEITGKFTKSLENGIPVKGSKSDAQKLAEEAVEHFGFDNVKAVMSEKGKINLHITNPGIKSEEVSNYLKTSSATSAYPSSNI